MKLPILTLLFLLSLTCPIWAVDPPPDGGYPNFTTAEGQQALQNVLPSATSNTALGFNALGSTTTGSYNTATGEGALNSNTAGNANVAIGISSSFFNSTGSGNTGALQNNTSGSNNIGVGNSAGLNLTTGDNNIEIGTLQLGLAGEANTIRLGVEGTQTATFVAGINGVNENSGNPVFIDPITGQLGTGTATQGVPSKTYLALQSGAPAPTGYTKVGTSVFPYRDNAGHNQTQPVDIYQKN